MTSSLGERRHAVRVTADAATKLRHGHPWLFDQSITHPPADKSASAGDVVVVFDPSRDFVGLGLWDPNSPIRVRMLHAKTKATINADWLGDTLDAAIELRRPLVERGDTTGYRVLHGEGDSVGGVVVDRYDDTLVIKVYSEAWLAHVDLLTELLVERLAPIRVVLRSGRNLAEVAPRSGVIWGEAVDGPVTFLEHGIPFSVDVVRGQKTGHFLDQRDNRAAVGAVADKCRVLDVFSSNGGFAAHAARGGATLVTCVDQSAHALEAAEAHVAGAAPERTTKNETYLRGDAFEVMEDLARRQRKHEIVVVDPPSFAQRADHTERALTAYRRLTDLALPLVAPGGLLVQASCSSRVDAMQFETAVRHSLSRSGRAWTIEARTGHAIDHPVTFAEGAYLKALFVRIDG